MHICISCGDLIPRGRCKQCGKTKTRGYSGNWPAISATVIERDHGQCQLQLAGCTTIATTADHIVPKAAGGTDQWTNLVAACRHCNSAKRDRTQIPPPRQTRTR
jgi:5-methylcytosine-specific restriction endonuclease McrA